jgi:hypothetical protein
MKKKPKIWTFSERLKYFILPFATMICYCIRMYASAVIAARFDFKYVHYVMDNCADIQDLDSKHEALHVLLYVERGTDEEPAIAFRSKLARHIVNLKRKGSIIDKDEPFQSVMLRVMLQFLEIENTRQLPSHMKAPQHLYALGKFGVDMKVEPELYKSMDHLKALILGNFRPYKTLDARTLPSECVDWIINYSSFFHEWLQFDTLNIDQQVLYLKDSPPSLDNDLAALPAIKLGLQKHTAAFLPRLYSDFCPDFKEIISFCNNQKIRFELAKTEEEIHILQAMLKMGLNHDLVHEDELILAGQHSFRVEFVNTNAFQNAVSKHTWREHLLRIAKNLTDEDWQEVECLVVADPSKLRLIPEEHQSARMVQAYYRHKKAKSNQFCYEHQAYQDMIPYLVSERPKLASKIVNRYLENKLGEAFTAEIEKLENLPSFVTKKSLAKNLNNAWLKDCIYSREYLRRADIAQVLACTTNGDALRFINKHIASREGDRHVDLYTEAVREDILLEELGL